MGGAQRFEDLVAWQKARLLTAAIYRATSQGAFSRDYKLRDQICSAAVSIMSNIAEGFDRNRPREFHQFLSTAKGSAAEVRSQLYVALDAGFVTQAEFDTLYAQASEVSRVVNGLRSAVERNLPDS